ncbi:helix-turn-helix domain-containing protein [Mycobacterium sp. Root135]|uniref:helix-turn-helix domain-containing protein n=1 Tax=Mycobacterium sp. Root135 TaxID=1736457 RepID=UPI001F2006C2|nr:helix-turn-helix transcriptional regulator [Mycobacterium sp. Root135]
MRNGRSATENLPTQSACYRLDHGFSQEAFADHMGVHRTYMGAVERGERNLTLQTLERIADFIGVDARELLDDLSG